MCVGLRMVRDCNNTARVIHGRVFVTDMQGLWLEQKGSAHLLLASAQLLLVAPALLLDQWQVLPCACSCSLVHAADGCLRCGHLHACHWLPLTAGRCFAAAGPLLLLAVRCCFPAACWGAAGICLLAAGCFLLLRAAAGAAASCPLLASPWPCGARQGVESEEALRRLADSCVLRSSLLPAAACRQLLACCPALACQLLATALALLATACSPLVCCRATACLLPGNCLPVIGNCLPVTGNGLPAFGDCSPAAWKMLACRW